MRGMEVHVLDGHAFVVGLAGLGAEEDESSGDQMPVSGKAKMALESASFDATTKDITALFGCVRFLLASADHARNCV